MTEHPTDPDRWLILAGHRRAAAAARAGLDRVPCIVRHNLADEDAEQLIVMVVENCQRKNLDPLERANAYGALRNRGLTLTEIGRRTGVKASTVSWYLNLLDLDDESVEQLRRGELGSGDAIRQVRTANQLERKQTGRAGRGRPKVVEPPHFTKRHPLAADAADTCDHTTRSRVGGVACGECWEDQIRADERARLGHDARQEASA